MNNRKHRYPWNRHSLLELNQGMTLITKTQIQEPLKIQSSRKENFFYLEQEQGHLILSPESSFSICWKTVNALSILSQTIIIPIILSFPYEEVYRMLILELCNSAFFLLDILIKLNTGFYQQGHLNTDRLSILLNYLKGNLIIDSYSVLPFSYFILKHQNHKFWLLPKLVKLTQLYTYFRTLKLFLKDLFWINFFYYFEIVLSIIFSVHWLACLWLYVSLYDVYNKDEVWAIYQVQYGIGSVYIKCIYYVVMTVTTLGYGDYYSIGVNEEIIAVIILFIGVIIFSFNITSVINVVMKYQNKLIKFKEKLMNFNIYMEEKDLPRFLRYKIRKYLEYKSNNERNSDIKESEILDLLSDPLREEIFSFTDSGKLVGKCKIFLKLYRDKVLKKLSRFFISRAFTRNDSVINQGELSTQLYFILAGRVEVIHDDTKTVFKILEQGNYFGEISFFTKRPRTATIRCIEIVNVLALKREDLDFILFKFPISAMATKELEVACKHGDYSVLEVKCYLCRNRGHIASFCPNSRLSPDKLNIPQQWISSKRKSKVIKEKSYFKPNAYRNLVPQKVVKYRNIPEFGEGELFKKLSSVRMQAFSESDEKKSYDSEKADIGINYVLSSEDSEDVEYNERRQSKFKMTLVSAANKSSDSSLSIDFI